MSNKVNFVIAIVVGALIVSVIFNLHYYVNLRVENENVLHNMRARALTGYGSEVGLVAHYLEEYLETEDFDIIWPEIGWSIHRATVQADILTQGLSEESGLMYYELKRTAWNLWSYFYYPEIYGPFNTTEVEIIAQALSAISDAFIDLYSIQNEDPLEVLEEPPRPGVDALINYCQQIQEIVRST